MQQAVRGFTPADLARIRRDLDDRELARLTYYKWRYQAEALGWDRATAARLAFCVALVRTGRLNDEG